MWMRYFKVKIVNKKVLLLERTKVDCCDQVWPLGLYFSFG